MPYWIVRRRPSRWCVIKDDDRRVMGRHGTLREAQAQWTALNIAESNPDKYKIEVTLPFPPTTNNAYATVNGRRVKSRAAREYAALADSIVRSAYNRPPLTTKERLEVRIELHPPTNRPFDVANREKVLVDAIAPALGFDDRQIDQLTITRRPRAASANDARAVVTISVIDEPPAS